MSSIIDKTHHHCENVKACTRQTRGQMKLCKRNNEPRLDAHKSP